MDLAMPGHSQNGRHGCLAPDTNSVSRLWLNWSITFWKESVKCPYMVSILILVPKTGLYPELVH